MAITPDLHPDSAPAEPSQAPDQVTPADEPDRDNLEEPSPMADPGSPGGTAGTGGTNRPQDRDITS